MKAAIYARVSTSNNGQDPTVQTREIEEYCARRGWKVAGQYIDVGISGAKEKRPQLDRLMADAHRRKFGRRRLEVRPVRTIGVSPNPRPRNLQGPWD